jgi:hypothetical protein
MDFNQVKIIFIKIKSIRDFDDVWNGDVLKVLKEKHSIHGISTHKFTVKCVAFGNIALDFATDGVALFKTSRTSMYPLVGSVFNLPPNMRTKKHNILLLGLYVGRNKIGNCCIVFVNIIRFEPSFVSNCKKVSKTGQYRFNQFLLT